MSQPSLSTIVAMDIEEEGHSVHFNVEVFMIPPPLERQYTEFANALYPEPIRWWESELGSSFDSDSESDDDETVVDEWEVPVSMDFLDETTN